MKKRDETTAHFAPGAVRSQLSRILASDAFVRSRRMQRFLEFIVEETLAGRSDQLGEYAIGVSVFDREEDFEPGLDPIVRNDARRLRLKIMEYYRAAHSPKEDEVLIDIPKGSYVPVFLPVSTGRVGALGDQPGRLAVFPFEVLSPAAEAAMFSRALCLSLTAKLTNLEGFEAVAHACLAEQSVREVASELRLSHGIHGCVLKFNEQCRVTVSLVQFPACAQIWAREYDFDSSEMLHGQAEIAAAVQREVKSRLGCEDPRVRLALVA